MEGGGGPFSNDVPHNADTLDASHSEILTELRRSGLVVVDGVGLSQARIDFAIEHPQKPGTMILAIETDGPSCLAHRTVRDRERLRQNQLERLGWSYMRVWTIAWARDPGAITERCLEASVEAMRRANHSERSLPPPSPPQPPLPAEPRAQRTRQRPLPRIGQSVLAYGHDELVLWVRWLLSDTLLRTRDEAIDELITELGWSRRGRRIVEALGIAFDAVGE
jgi:very-short-patch-repair endonuclease